MYVPVVPSSLVDMHPVLHPRRHNLLMVTPIYIKEVRKTIKKKDLIESSEPEIQVKWVTTTQTSWVSLHISRSDLSNLGHIFTASPCRWMPACCFSKDARKSLVSCNSDFMYYTTLLDEQNMYTIHTRPCRSQWPCGLSQELSSLARMLES
jgi:hypothetical protein